MEPTLCVIFNYIKKKLPWKCTHASHVKRFEVSASVKVHIFHLQGRGTVKISRFLRKIFSTFSHHEDGVTIVILNIYSHLPDCMVSRP
jgi:hypothetical protein